MKELQTARDVYVIAEVMTQVLNELEPTQAEALEAAFEAVTGIPDGGTQAQIDEYMNTRAAAVREFDPIEGRIRTLEKTLERVIELASMGGSMKHRANQIQALAERVLK